MKVKIKVDEGVELPKYATDGSAGFDIKCTKLLNLFNGVKELPIELLSRSLEKGSFMLRPHERALLGTGIYLEIPVGYELQIRPRSGISAKRGLVTTLGTIDNDYRGEVKINVVNTTNFLSKIDIGEAVCQGVIAPIEQAEWEQVNDVLQLSVTIRGAGGFGHTDKPKTNENNTSTKE